MTEQELKDEREQAVKRGGEIYADHYIKGLIDGSNLTLRQFAVSGSFIPEAEIKQAAKEDYGRQRKYDNAYDRQKGFIEGVKWAIKRLKNYR
jgi:hypothetical protein